MSQKSIQFLKGQSADLSQEAIQEGNFLFTEDTNELYIDYENSAGTKNRKPIKDKETADKVAQLEERVLTKTNAVIENSLTVNGYVVQGKYSDFNEESAKYAHVVGGGTSEEDRKNIHTLDWEGNATFAGDVTATKEDGTEVSLVEISDMSDNVAYIDATDNENVTDATVTEGYLHTHDNKDILDKLSESKDGKLLFDGKELEGNGRSITSVTTDENNNVFVTFSDGVVENVGKLNFDAHADFLTESGFGNLRYYNGHLQSYDKNSSTWVDTSVTPENVYMIKMLPQEMKAIKGIYDVDLGYYKLKFEEPSDTIIEGQIACVVEKVIIRRKLNSVPESENDGELVTEIRHRDFGSHKNAWYVDRAFKPSEGEVWYYKAFPISTLGFTNASSTNETIGLLCKDYYLYGFKLDQNESDPASMISYIEDNTQFSSAYMNYASDTFYYGDWQDAFFMNVKPCMLNYDGTVAYELNPNDYTKKLDSTDSDIADVNFAGNVMVGIPKVYWKIVDNGDETANIYISNKKLDEDFVCWSHIDNNGEEIDYCYMPAYNGCSDGTRLRSLSDKGTIYSQYFTDEIRLAKANNQDENIIWYTEVFSDRMLINLLLLLIGKSTNTQTVFGNGHYTGGSKGSHLLTTGTLNSKGLFYGTNGTWSGVKIFGMENWWGNSSRRISGWINDNGIQKIKLTYSQTDGSTVEGYNTDGSGYISIGCTPSGTIEGYISKMSFTKYGLIPVVNNGSSTTYYTDVLGFVNSSIREVAVGGNCSIGFEVGAFHTRLNIPVNDYGWVFTSSPSCKPLKN